LPSPRVSVLLDWRSPVGVEAFDRLQSPGLALLPFRLRPDDGRPVGREHEPRAGAGDLDTIPAGFVDVQKERLLDRVLVRSGLDVDAVFEEDIRRAKHLFSRVDGVCEVVESAARPVMIGGERQVVALVRRRYPRAG